MISPGWACSSVAAPRDRHAGSPEDSPLHQGRQLPQSRRPHGHNLCPIMKRRDSRLRRGTFADPALRLAGPELDEGAMVPASSWAGKVDGQAIRADSTSDRLSSASPLSRQTSRPITNNINPRMKQKPGHGQTEGHSLVDRTPEDAFVQQKHGVAPVENGDRQEVDHRQVGTQERQEHEQPRDARRAPPCPPWWQWRPGRPGSSPTSAR